MPPEIIISSHSHTVLHRDSPTTGEKQAKKSEASTTARAVLGTEVAVLGMCNNNNDSDSRKRSCAAIYIVGFIMKPRGRAELGVAQDSDKSLRGLEP